MATTPPLEETGVVRECTRMMAYRPDGSIVHCGAPAPFHVCWTWPNADTSFVCMKHYAELGTRWSLFQIHRVGDDCGMPLSLWDGDNNRCMYLDDNLPTVEVQERDKVGTS